MFSSDTKILVIDDMLTMRKIIRKSLMGLGFTSIEEASDGNLGWAAIENAHTAGNAFELVLCDWNMPNMTGIDLLKTVRADDRFIKLPFVLITAESDQSQVLQAIKLGVSNYVVKPFSEEDLKNRLTATYQRVASDIKRAEA